MGKKALIKKAKKLQLKGLCENKINPEQIPALDELLRDAYAACKPNPIDYYNRKDLVRIFNAIAKEIYGNSDDIPVVEEFGSFLMDIFAAKSDLDLSVNFAHDGVDFPREKKIQSLRKFAKMFYKLQRKGHISSVNPILTAKVPILKIVDRGTGVECDISIENRDGVFKSQIVRLISSMDERFRMLSMLMKAWAKAHDINSSKDRTLNSLSLISLVALHLQTRDPPILPPFSAIFKDGTDLVSVGKIVTNHLNCGARNEESLGELFVTLLIKLASVETLWPKGLCASTYNGSWIFKTWDSLFGCISVEDFTDRSQNVARAVGTKEVKKIYKCIHLSIQYVFAFMNGLINGTKLREFLFGRESVTILEEKSPSNCGKRKVESHVSLDPTPRKKKRSKGRSGETKQVAPINAIQTNTIHSTEGREGTPIKRWCGTPAVGGEGTPGERREGKQQSIHVEQIQPKRIQRTVGHDTLPDPGQSNAKVSNAGWEGTPGELWGGKQPSIQFEQIQPKRIQRTVGHASLPDPGQSNAKLSNAGWEGTPGELWGGKQPSIQFDQMQPRRMQPTVAWGGIQQATLPDPGQSNAKLSDAGWEGTPGELWGGKQLSIHFDQMQPRRMQPAVAWGGIQQATLPDPRQRNEKLYDAGWEATPTEGWGGKQLSAQLDHIQPKRLRPPGGWGVIPQTTPSDSMWRKEMLPAASWGGNASYVSTKFLSVPTHNAIGNGMSGGPLFRYPSLPAQNPSGFDGSHMYEMVPMPQVGSLHAQHAPPSHLQNHRPPSNRYGSW